MEFNNPHLNEKPLNSNRVPVLSLRNTKPTGTPLWLIAEQVARKHGLSVAELRGNARKGRISPARFEYYYRAANETGATLTQIARQVYVTDHTCVIYGMARFAVLYDLPMPRNYKGRRGYPKRPPHGGDRSKYVLALTKIKRALSSNGR